MLPIIFEPTVSDIRRQNAEAAVDMLRDILHAEARLQGLPPTAVSVSSNVTASDGGIDAETTSNKPETSPNGLIEPGRTGFQVKSGSFSFAIAADIKGLLYRPASRRKLNVSLDDLLPRVRSCLEDNGTFIIVLTGTDTPQQTDNSHVESVRAQLVRADAKFSAAKIRIIYPNQLTKLVCIAPGRALVVKGIAATGNVFPVMWMSECCDFADFFEASSEQDEAIRRIQDAIGSKAGLTHIRVVGEAGCGKTRLVYEALKVSTLASQVLYCPDGETLTSDVLQQLRMLAANCQLILAVDECDPQERGYIHKQLRSAGKNITLITVFNEFDDQDTRSADYLFMEPPKLPVAQISAIIQSYGVPVERANMVGKLCDGSPLAAHRVGESLAASDNIPDLLSPQGLDNVWDHYLAGASGRKSAAYQERHVVLACLALFKRFGWGDLVKDEAVKIHELLIKQIDPNISWAKFDEIVCKFIERRTLQGNVTLYIRPKLLHIKLWCDWWLKYSPKFDVEALLKQFDGNLGEWFAEMFVYAREAEPAARVVEKLLSDDGPYKSLRGFMAESDSHLFFKLAQVSPKAAAQRIHRALKEAGHDQLLTFGDGRRYVVHALQHLALYGSCFENVADSLLMLAMAENETWSNNASGEFAELFGLGVGSVAPTELSPLQRLPVLLKYAKSTDFKLLKLVLTAFDHSLKTQITRFEIGSQHGLRDVPKGWEPATYSELWKSYRTYLDSLWAAQIHMPVELKYDVYSIVLSHTRALILLPITAERLLEILPEIASVDEERGLKVVDCVTGILHYDKSSLPIDVVTALEGIRAAITDDSYAGQMKRYVRLNLLEDKFDEDGEYIDQPVERLEELARQSIAHPQLLIDELSWLVSAKAENGHTFGHRLGLMDEDILLWREIARAWQCAGEGRSDFFIGGYLRGVFERNANVWETLIIELYRSAETKWVPALVWRSGMSRLVAKTLLEGASAGDFDALDLRLFSYGAGIRDVPNDLAAEMIGVLVKRGGAADLMAALELFQTLYPTNVQLDEAALDLAESILAHSAFFTKTERSDQSTSRDYLWNEQAMRLLKLRSSSAIELAAIAIEHLGEDGTVVGGFSPQTLKFLNAIMELFPTEIWAIVTKYIGPNRDSHSYYIMQWLRGDFGHRRKGIGVLAKIPKSLIWEWIDQNVDEHAWYIAEYSPFELSRANDESTLTRELLVKYGALSDVRSALRANYHTEGWTGSASAHMKNKLDFLSAIADVETDENVKLWIKEEMDALEERIKLAIVREERQEF